MTWTRRLVLQSAASAPLLATARPAAAATAHYPMACDPALLVALRDAAEAFRAQTDIFIHMLPTAPALLVPQLTHEIQNDIVMARSDIMTAVDAVGLYVPGAPRPRFRDRLVVAALAGASPDAWMAGPIAVTDKTPGRDRDDVAILTGLGLAEAKRQGALDSGEVAYLVTTGAARAGLMLMSDVRANPTLAVAREAPVADSTVFIAATTRAPRRPQPEAFVAFLASSAGAAILARHGLEALT